MFLPRFTILCVDDDPGYRRYLEYSLGSMYNVEFADSGRQFLDMAKDLLFDLVLIDATLPDMSSDKVLESLKEESSYDKTPIIIVYYNDTSRERLSHTNLGYYDFLSKVASPNEIRAMLEMALETAA